MSGRFLIHGFLLIIAVFTILNGILILQKGFFKHPLNRYQQVEGGKARITGLLLIVIGIVCLLMMLNLPDLASL